MARLAYLIFLSTVIASCGGRIESGNAEGVSVDAMDMDSAGALRTAEEHCKKFGKSARIQQTGEANIGRRTFNFICVRPGG